MSDTKELLERARARFTPPEGVMESLIRRRARKERNHRLAAAVLALVLALATFAGLIQILRTTERPAEPTPRNIFAQVHGWIAYGAFDGIWAVNPTAPGDPEDQVQLRDRFVGEVDRQRGQALAWSSDGSKLLFRRIAFSTEDTSEDATPHYELFVLNADGTETRLTRTSGWITGGSLSPDGLQVVFSCVECVRLDFDGIYTVDADGGTPRLVLPARPVAINPAFSPDGTQIAYIGGKNDWGTSLRVMNADGTGVRVLVSKVEFSGMDQIVWSPDGSRLAFSVVPPGEGGGIWIVGIDGSGLTRVIPHGENPAWSPDGSRISYQPVAPCVRSSLDSRGAAYGCTIRSPDPGRYGRLEIATLDGTRVTSVQKFGNGGSGPWNPLPLSVPGDGEPTDAAGGVSPFIYAIVALGILGVLTLAWRARRRTAARLKRSAVLALALALAACSDGGTGGIAGRVTSTPNPPSSQHKSAFIDLQTGEVTPLPQSITGGYSYRVSPDGTMFAFNDAQDYPPVAVSVANIDGTGVRQISPDGIDAFAASWSPDGSMLVYQGRDAATIEVGNLFVVDVTTEEVRQVTDLKPRYNWWFMWPSFAPDGGTILFHLARRHGVGPSGTVWDLWSVSVSGGDPVLVRRNAGFGTYSPDGRTLAFLSPLNPAADATGDALWLVDVAGGNPRVLIEGKGIWWPSWSPDGTRIAYAVPKTNDIYVVDITTGKSTRAQGGVAEWFDDHTLIVGPGIA